MAGRGTGRWLVAALSLTGCYLHHQDADVGVAAPSDTFQEVPLPTSEPDDVPEQAAEPCLRGEREVTLSALPVDLLFVVDDSGSMTEEQTALAREFPLMARVLATGDLNGDGAPDFPPVRDLHLGVVSANLGVGGVVGVPGCEGLGDDGRLIDTSAIVGCPSRFPRFLSYDGDAGDDPDALAADFACVARVGSEGCGFEQPLESALKALWPGEDVELPGGGLIDGDVYEFVGDIGGGSRRGHGSGENDGFLRHDRGSLVGIVLLTDEEDCSSASTRHFVPDRYLAADDPLREQDLQERCYLNPDGLHPIERYVEGYRGLRPGADHLVFLAAIVGVPTDLVNEAARDRVDFGDAAARDRYYQDILDDPRMVGVSDPLNFGALSPSCIAEGGSAFPPRRIVEVVRGFGANAVLQSICSGDFSPAMRAILTRLGETIQVATCISQ